jgi:hypothetical protein
MITWEYKVFRFEAGGQDRRADEPVGAEGWEAFPLCPAPRQQHPRLFKRQIVKPITGEELQ